jgi:hypothetical protein
MNEKRPLPKIKNNIGPSNWKLVKYATRSVRETRWWPRQLMPDNQGAKIY